MRRVKTCGLCLVLALVVGLPTMSWAQAEQRPIDEFLAAQRVGPDIIDFTSWYDPVTWKEIQFDAFGTFNEAFGLNVLPTFNGRVTVRALADGRAHVSVLLQTTNGLCWGYQSADPTVPEISDNAFGSTPEAVALGKPAARGHGVLRIEFTMPAPESPLPAYFDLVFFGISDYWLESVATVINCDGVLHAGSGYPEGIPGKARTTQTGLFTTGVPGGCPPEKDASCFPAERVEFWPAGRQRK